MNRIFAIWQLLHDEAEEIGDRLVIVAVCVVAVLYAVGVIS